MDTMDGRKREAPQDPVDGDAWATKDVRGAYGDDFVITHEDGTVVSIDDMEAAGPPDPDAPVPPPIRPKHRAVRGELWKLFPEIAEADRAILPRLWAAAMDRMEDEEMIRALGSVPAEIAERLVADFVEGNLERRGNKSWGVIAPDGRRIQVKALRMTDAERNTVGNFPDRREFDQYSWSASATRWR